MVIFASIPVHHHFALVPMAHGVAVVTTASGTRDGGGLVAICAVVFVGGLLSIVRFLPFGLTLGVSRRSYFTGTMLLGVSLAATYGLALTLLQAIERATGGWGVTMHFFQVPYVLEGPWYLTWLTALLFVYGMWFGLVYRRWDVTGLIVFIAAQLTVLLAGAMAVTWAATWRGVGHFFTSISAAGLTGVLAGLVVVLVAGGYATVRRATV
jgi:hypothetical protein